MGGVLWERLGTGISMRSEGQEVKGQLPVVEVEGGGLRLAPSSSSGSVSRATG